MKFSIVTPVLNGMSNIRRCVGSVRGQKEAEYEHIIMDGVSTDGTIGWLKTQNGLKLRSEPDNGMYDAINRGWALASGDILSWLNFDEQYLPGTLKKVAAYFKAHTTVDAVFGNAIITNKDGDPFAARREIPLRALYVANGFLYAMSCTTFYRRKLWDSGILHLDTQYRYSADSNLVLHLLKAGIKYGHINDYLSLFSVEDGRNLSFQPEMIIESRRIRQKHGGFKSLWLQQLMLFGRKLERVLRGCYKREAVSYEYAANEIPDYVTKHSERLNFRFTFEKFSRKHGHAENSS